MKKLLLTTLVGCSLVSVASAQNIMGTVDKVAGNLTNKSGAAVNAQIGVVSKGKVKSEADANKGGIAAAGVNAMALKAGGKPNAAAAINAQIGWVNGGEVENKAKATGKGSAAAAGVNAMAAGE